MNYLNVPKKSLGQNFLIDNNILNSIADLGKIDTHDTVLEIGPGTGNLTSKLINKNPKKIVAVEKDNNLCSILQKKFKQNHDGCCFISDKKKQSRI